MNCHAADIGINPLVKYFKNLQFLRLQLEPGAQACFRPGLRSIFPAPYHGLSPHTLWPVSSQPSRNVFGLCSSIFSFENLYCPLKVSSNSTSYGDVFPASQESLTFAGNALKLRPLSAFCKSGAFISSFPPG